MWKYAESMEKPAITDETSSKKWVYIRRNVEERERIDETGETVTYYAFEEMKIPKEDYPIYQQVETNTANIDYLAMMTNIDIDNEEGE